MRKKVGIVALMMVGLIALLLAGSWWWVTRAFPQTSGTLTLAGLEGPVEIRRDEWGVPHVYATSLHDLYFAQGVVHAQDRLWQMDFQRRVGLGRLSEILGEPTLKTDQFLRTIGTGAAAQRDWEALSSDAKAYLQAYTDGVNAYMATNPTLPLEYQLLQVGWEPWEPAHTLAWGKMMQWDLNGNWDEEILRAQLMEKVGAERMALLMGDGTVSGSTTPMSIGTPDMEALADTLRLANLGRANGAGERGSNAWVVAGSRTESGRALLANDPHLGIGMPGIWYEVGLHAPGMDVVGASLPGVPAVVSGHNGTIAWGMTNLATDTQDLFIERLDEAGSAYEWQGEMFPLTVRREVIRVKGQEDVVIEVKETRHGPLLNDVVEGLTEPIAFQWRATMAPTRLAESILAVNRASNREEFIDALRLWDSPAQNLMYADIEGNIGYVATGDLPIRPAAGGLLPQPGWTGEWDWQGMVPFEEQLQSWNPAEGYLLTANELPFPDAYPYYTGSAWAAPFRANRIRQLLEENAALTIDDIQAMQGDVTSLAAPTLVPHLLNVSSDDLIVQRAQEQLASWNYVIDGRLPGAGIYQVTHGFVVREMLGDELGEELLDEYIDYIPDQVLLVSRLLEEPEHPLWDDTRTSEKEGRDAILHRALLAMTDWMGRRYGDVPHEWFWDRLHTATFDHPLGAVQPLDRIFNRQLTNVSGDRNTVNANGFLYGAEYVTTNIPSYRQIVDVGAWENSRMMHTTGQSGQPFHPHYDDMIERWQRVELGPMYWSEAQTTEASQGRVLRLEP